jgi:hypothetical protein
MSVAKKQRLLTTFGINSIENYKKRNRLLAQHIKRGKRAVKTPPTKNHRVSNYNNYSYMLSFVNNFFCYRTIILPLPCG